MAYQVKGRIIAITPVLSRLSKRGENYEIQRVAICRKTFDPNTGEPTYNEREALKFTLVGKRTADLQGAAPGHEITLDVDFRGDEYNGDMEALHSADLIVLRAKNHSAPAENAPAAPDSFAQALDKAKDVPERTAATVREKAVNNNPQTTDDLPW